MNNDAHIRRTTPLNVAGNNGHDLPVAHLPFEEEPPSPHSQVHRLMSTLFRHKVLVLAATAIGGLIAAFIALLQPNVYVSNATFRFQEGGETLQLQFRTGPDQQLASRQNLAGIAPHVLLDPELLERTVKRAGLETVMAPFQPKTAVPQNPSWIDEIGAMVCSLQRKIHQPTGKPTIRDGINQLLWSLELEQVEDVGVLKAQYSASSPEIAKKVLEAYTQEAIKFHLEIYTDTGAITWLKQNYDTAKKAFDEADRKLSTFLDKLKVVDFNSELLSLQGEERSSRQNVVTLREVTIPALELQLADAQKALKQTEPMITVERMVTVDNPLIPIYEGQRREQKARLAELNVRLAKKDAPEIIRVKGVIATIEKDLATERNKPLETIKQKTVQPNPAYATLEQRIQETNLDLVVNRDNLRRAVTRQRATAKETTAFLASRPKFLELSADVESTRAMLSNAQNQLLMAQQKQDLNEQSLSSLKLVGSPTLELEKVGPERGWNVLLGLLGGLAVGIMILTLRTITDSTVRTTEELESMVGVRVLATIPRLDRKNIRRHQRRLTRGC